MTTRHAIAAALALAYLPVASVRANAQWTGANVTAFEVVRWVHDDYGVNNDAGSTSLTLGSAAASIDATVSFDVAAEAKISEIISRVYTFNGYGNPPQLTVNVSGSISGARDWGSSGSGSANSSTSTPALSDGIGLAASYGASGGTQVLVVNSGTSVSSTLFADATTSGQSGFHAHAYVSFNP